MQPFLALITPLSSGDPPRPDQGLPPGQGGVPSHPIYYPPGIWGPTDPRPTHPIAGIPPGGVPGQPPYPSHPIYNPPYPDQGLPGQQPRPDQGLPGQPPGIWGPNDPRPTPPIYIPPEGSPPPLGIWGPTDPRPGYGLPGPQPHPEHPIVLPPDLPTEIPDVGKIDWKTAWTPTTGWVIVGIPAEGTLVPTPST